MNGPGPELADDLAATGLAAARELRRRAAWRHALQSWGRDARWILLVPLAVLAAHLLQRACGVAAIAVPTWFVLALALLPPAAAATWTFARRLLAPADARSGLARLDRELHAAGRLQAAHEFLAADARTSFMTAAVEDSTAHLQRARSHRLAHDARQRHWSRTVLAPLAAAVLAFAAGLVMPTAPGAGDSGAPTVSAVANTDASPARRAAEAPKSQPANRPEPKAREPQHKVASAKAGREERKPTTDLDQPVRESEGKSGEGTAANAESGSSSSESKGFQSSQAPPTEQANAKKTPPKKPKPPKPEKDTAANKKTLEQSGSTAGKGTGSGSNKNPSSTEWSSKDQVATDEEQPIADDLDVEDDTDESEARGGLQPNLRDRRPAVNRDLIIGFGNAPPPPDANGRGGPGEQKKSRGVASLVLGVPIPDHVKGQLNPGKIKITQERVEPRADDAEPIAAASRDERSRPIGSLHRAELTPWMRELVRSYFLQIRTKNETPR